MADLRLTIDVQGGDRIAGYFRELPDAMFRDLDDRFFRPKVTPIIERSFEKTFESKGRGSWRDLTPRYAEAKNRMLAHGKVMRYPAGTFPVRFGGGTVGKLTGAMFEAATKSTAPAAVRVYTDFSGFVGVDPNGLPQSKFFHDSRKTWAIFLDDERAIVKAMARLIRETVARLSIGRRVGAGGA